MPVNAFSPLSKSMELPTLPKGMSPAIWPTPPSNYYGQFRPTPRVYLAGPDVFLPQEDRVEIEARKKAICAKYGFEGVFPTDNQADLRGLAPYEQGIAISQADERTMDSCDLVVANATPWPVHPTDQKRVGLSTDVGTAFEMGYMRAQHKGVFAYSNVPINFFERMSQWLQGNVNPRLTEPWFKVDANDHMIDATQHPDNLMLPGGVHNSGGVWITQPVDNPKERFTDLNAFEQVVAEAAKRYHTLDAVG
ncbi:MAG: nucleoside 2-deoxyribosyltransferase [Candidatus Melainabacteria bacterium]|nr:nucleoside 2-deoxyribosyltransferase [Candidatus Melainabacteria bacterium]